MLLQTRLLKIFGSRLALHIYFWIFIFSIFTILNLRASGFRITVIRNLILLPTDIATTYISIYLILPFVLNRKKIFHAIILFSLMVLSLTLLANFKPYQRIYHLAGVPLRDTPFIYRFVYTYYSTLMVSGLAATIKLIKKYYLNQSLRHKMAEQNLRNQLDLLKHQVNPHFMFNSLNNISSLTHISPDKTQEAIIKLSELMRYMVYEANSERVSLVDELNYIENFIALQTLRIKQKNFVSIKKSGIMTDRYIEPMLLIPFVENAFKFCNKKYSPGIWIEYLNNDSEFIFSIVNTIRTVNPSDNPSSGFGIGNVKKRLDLLYPGRHELKIESDQRNYSVMLKLKTKKNVTKED